MIEKIQGEYPERTLLDIELAKVYFELLVTLARDEPGQTITYGNLVREAKLQHPDNEFLEAAIATNIGRRLDAVRQFTRSKKLPDLTALAVNQSTGDNGIGFKRAFDGESVREEISKFDWGSVRVSFDDFISKEILAVKAREEKRKRTKKISESEARDILWKFYTNRKEDFSNGELMRHKEAIIKLIMKGIPPDDAVAQSLS
jgi:hypothetical protein